LEQINIALRSEQRIAYAEEYSLLNFIDSSSIKTNDTAEICGHNTEKNPDFPVLFLDLKGIFMF